MRFRRRSDGHGSVARRRCPFFIDRPKQCAHCRKRPRSTRENCSRRAPTDGRSGSARRNSRNGRGRNLSRSSPSGKSRAQIERALERAPEPEKEKTAGKGAPKRTGAHGQKWRPDHRHSRRANGPVKLGRGSVVRQRNGRSISAISSNAAAPAEGRKVGGAHKTRPFAARSRPPIERIGSISTIALRL